MRIRLAAIALATLALVSSLAPAGEPDAMIRSDRDQKTSFAPIDERNVLEGVARLPMSTWTYTNDPHATRHLGPSAQDFKREFALGGTEKAYDPVDAHGVALASIKALHQIVTEQNARIERLERENRDLAQRVRARPTGGRAYESDIF